MTLGVKFDHPVMERGLRAIPGVTWTTFDCPCDYIVTHSRLEYAAVKHLPTPKIVTEHELPGETFTPSPYIGDPLVKRIVLSTPEQLWAWQLASEISKIVIIPAGHDFSNYPVWQGGYAAVLNLTNCFATRDYPCGYGIWDTLTHDLPRILAGRGNEGIPGAIGNLTHLEVQQHLMHCNVFLNTTRYSTAPNALLEAMAVGIPIVSTHTWFSESLLAHTATVSNDLPTLRAALERQLTHPTNPHMDRNRRLVRDLYSMEQHVFRWLRMLESL